MPSIQRGLGDKIAYHVMNCGNEREIARLGLIDRRGEVNTTRRSQSIFFALCSLVGLASTSSLASAEVITYDYDNAGQVTKVI